MDAEDVNPTLKLEHARRQRVTEELGNKLGPNMPPGCGFVLMLVAADGFSVSSNVPKPAAVKAMLDFLTEVGVLKINGPAPQ